MKIGVDWGGTKIEAAALNDSGDVVWRKRMATPQHDYRACLNTVHNLVTAAEQAIKTTASVGIGIPGSISPESGLVRNANSEWINGQALEKDISVILDRPVRITNDANCFAVSEAVDGAGAGAHCVFGVIIGTGVGGGVAIDGKAHQGRTKIAGEWGHTPMPFSPTDQAMMCPCWCGRAACVETFLSGPSFERQYKNAGGVGVKAATIIERMRKGEMTARLCFNLYAERLARGLAVIINILDPDVIVLGGGMSNSDELYEALPAQITPHVFSDYFNTPVLKAFYGDSSGVRGAAHLW